MMTNLTHGTEINIYIVYLSPCKEGGLPLYSKKSLWENNDIYVLNPLGGAFEYGT